MMKVAWKDFHLNLNPKRRHPFKNFDKEKWKELMSFIETNYDEISRHMMIPKSQCPTELARHATQHATYNADFVREWA